MEYYIGVDLGKQSSFFVVKDKEGLLKGRAKVLNDSVSIAQMLKPYLHESCQAVIEATCNHYWMHEQLTSLGCLVKVAHPLKTRAIADAKVKNDRLDANILCDLLRADLIPQSYLPPEKTRFLRELVRQHIRLVQMRTQVKNQVHSLLTKLNYRHESTDLFGKKGVAWLSGLELKEPFGFERSQLLSQLEHYNRLVKEVDQKITIAMKQDPMSAKLQSIPGIGAIGSAVILAEIGPIERFPSAKKLVSYAGIAPGLYESGRTHHSRGITREGNKFLRWILCEMTQVHIRKPGPLREFFLRLKEKKGYRKALVATARKLLIGVYFVLKGKNFSPSIAG